MGRNILHVIEVREQQGTEGPLAHDRTVTFQVYEPERLRMPVSNLAVSGVSPTVLRRFGSASWYLWCGGDCRYTHPRIAKDPARQRVQLLTR